MLFQSLVTFFYGRQPLTGLSAAKIRNYMKRLIHLILFLSAAFAVSCGPDSGTVELPDAVKTGLYAEPEIPDADAACVIYYKAEPGSTFFNYTGDLYAHIGIVLDEWRFVQAQWTENIAKCKFTKTDTENLWSLSIAPTIRQWFGSGDEEVSKIGVVVRSSDGKTQTADLFIKVSDSKNAFEPAGTVYADVPAGNRHGINYSQDNSVTFVLYDRDAEGKSYDYCYIIGEFSGWKRKPEYAMKRDEAKGCWWITLAGMPPDEEHLFQYHIGKTDGTSIRLSDPYTEIVYDGANDKYISSSTYPGLRKFPDKTSGLVSAFRAGRKEYAWKNPDFRIEDADNLVIYELLLRDFSSTGDINGAMARLDYLEELGINAIELMPVQEFDGNDSWGYNPCSYFAMDKAYGTPEMYKNFIDECHSRGIAVLLDVVYNQATGAHPMAKLYWNAGANKTSASNPWFNVDAPHPYNVFHDWNHENEMVREHVKRNLEFLLTEYHVDGFRFDLTKGFTQRKCNEATASNYDQNRIDVLKEYFGKVKEVNPDAVVILEHFCALAEEKVLGEAGMKLWRNLNNAYCQTAMGYQSDSDFSGLYTGTSMPFGSLVSFMESHDEERACYKQTAYGNGPVKTNLELRMQRAATNAAFFLTVPGPKMIWQFGELGYDVSLEQNGRTGKKPLHWEYLDNEYRKNLHDTYAGLLKFRRENPEFFRSDAEFSWKVSTSDWAGGRYIWCTAAGKTFLVAGNFDDSDHTLNINMPSGGRWTNYFNSSESVEMADDLIMSTVVPKGCFKMFINF